MDDKTFQTSRKTLRIEEVEKTMPLVFIFVAFLFWVTVATFVAFARLSRGTLRWIASLGRGPRGSHH